MKADTLEKAIEIWIDDRPNWFRRSARWMMAFYHHRLPQMLLPPVIFHFLVKSTLAASAPALAYLVYGTISLSMAVVAGVILFSLSWLASVLDRSTRAKTAKKDSDETEAIVRVGELLRMCVPASRRQSSRDDMVRAALGILENYSRQVTKAKAGDIGVAIALYVGESSTNLMIRHRNPGNTRPVGREFNGNGVLGHHACMHGTGPKIVHNIKRMHRDLWKSPTNSEVNYRSFLLIPLTVKRDGEDRVGGFLSIDCTSPYAFHGTRGRVLIVNLEPIVEHIQELL